MHRFIKFVFPFILMLFAFQLSKVETYTLKEGSVKWESNLEEGNNHFGTISLKSAQLSFDGDRLVRANIKIDPGTIRCHDLADEGYNDEHTQELKSKEVLDIKKYQSIDIAIVDVQLQGTIESKYNYTTVAIIGIKEAKDSLNLDVTVDLKNNTARLNGKFEAKKEDFDLPYNIIFKLDVVASKS